MTFPNEDLTKIPPKARLCAGIRSKRRLSENLRSRKCTCFIGGMGFSVKHYIQIIAAKFSGSSDRNQSNGSANSGKNREDEAREYEERRAREERARGRAEQERTSNQESDSPFSRQNSKTAKRENGYTWTIRSHTFSFSPSAFFAVMQTIFGRGSITWHTLHDPVAGLRLFAASFLWGVAFAAVILVLAGVGHSITDTRPLWDITLKNAFSFLVAVGMIWKARAFFHAGWFR